MSFSIPTLFPLAAIASLAAPLPAQDPSPHATRVLAVDDQGGAGGGIFAPDNALGPPLGGGFFGGSLDVTSLGIGGSLTLGFDVTITDGPGADFVVFENPFQTGAGFSFAEVCFVEVSSDGVVFARFPSAYHGPDVDPGSFGSSPLGAFAGLAGSLPVLSGSGLYPNADPRNLVALGGAAFDLADLAGVPEVLAGTVDVTAIQAVRLVDVRSGIDLDSRGVPIRDAGAGSADIDGVTVLQHLGNQDVGAPEIRVEIETDGRFAVTVIDPDGLGDLDVTRWHAALLGVPIDVLQLLQLTWITEFEADRVRFELPFTLPPGVLYTLSLSIADRSGAYSGDSAVRPVSLSR